MAEFPIWYFNEDIYLYAGCNFSDFKVVRVFSLFTTMPICTMHRVLNVFQLIDGNYTVSHGEADISTEDLYQNLNGSTKLQLAPMAHIWQLILSFHCLQVIARTVITSR